VWQLLDQAWQLGARGGRRYKLPEQEVAATVADALQLVNMRDFEHRATHTLSGGQRQRVAIAGGTGAAA
jgi:energy-coupling factor transporter ATP-binding protein EcfA2